MLKIGLTGGIGSGKTRVADLLQARGAAIIDSDAIAHALTAPGGAGIAPLRAAFGDEMIDAQGALDRARMRELVFRDRPAKAQLEAILHPMIRTHIDAAAAQSTGLYQVFVVPLLVESGQWAGRVDRVCVVDCDEETQIRRVQARSGLTRDAVERIMLVQAMRDERLGAADDVIVNDGATTADELEARVETLHARWRELSSLA
jgi:dephospho-CoA kinase